MSIYYRHHRYLKMALHKRAVIGTRIRLRNIPAKVRCWVGGHAMATAGFSWRCERCHKPTKKERLGNRVPGGPFLEAKARPVVESPPMPASLDAPTAA